MSRWLGREDGLVEKSRDMGLSWPCVAIAVWMWLFKPGTVIGFGSRKEEYVDKLGDPKSLFWKARQFIALLPAEFQPVGYIEGTHAPAMRIINPENGSAIVGESGDNIGRGNRTSIYFKDESAFYERPDAIDAAACRKPQTARLTFPHGTARAILFYRKRMSGRIPVFVFDWKDDPRKGNTAEISENPYLEVTTSGNTVSIHFQFAPYGLKKSSWKVEGSKVEKLAINTLTEYFPNLQSSIKNLKSLTPLDLEQTYGLTEGDLNHGQLMLDQFLFMRPLPGWSDHRTPIDHLYLCGSGVHGGGGVSGITGRNVARVLK